MRRQEPALEALWLRMLSAGRDACSLAPVTNWHALSVAMLAMLAMLAVLGAAAPFAGAAETYGELGRFGAAGVGQGQFTLSRGTHAFGVDPTNDTVYVGDEPTPGAYRIQELTAGGTFVAHTATFSPPHPVGIEGIAIDPKLKRLYVLALEKRVLPELEIAVAGTLYAFSTTPEGETLPAASGTKAGVLTTPAMFLAHASPVSRAIAEPRGIAVDPSTDDVIVMGEVLESEELESNPIMLQRIDSATGALGARYTTTALERETVNSPTVSPTGSVYVAQFDAVLQVPSDFTSAEAPVRLGGVREEGLFEGEQALLLLPDPSALQGGGLSFAPTGPHGEPEGALEAATGVFDEGSYYPGVVAFDAATGAEAGWSGGESSRAGGSCTIGFRGPIYTMVAAGGEGTVFVLDSQHAQVVELGPGGAGCPTAADGGLKALVGGTPLSGQIEAGTEVTLESNLVQADAVSVEWRFDEGEAQPLQLAGDDLQHTEVLHTFEQAGEHMVSEVIHTDDLATPIVEASAIVIVRSGKAPPTAVIGGPIAVDVGQQAAFDGSASWDPNGHLGATAITRYEWSFGDGSSAVTEAPKAQHIYSQPGLYTASLVVEDALGLKSEAASIPVAVKVPPPPVHEPAPGEGAAGGLLTEGGGEAPAPPSGTTTPPAKGATVAPIARLGSVSLPVSAAGVVKAVVSCPGAIGRCEGTLSLSTLGRLADKHGRRVRRKAHVLASGSFSIAAGREQSVRLQLPRMARALLRRDVTLSARVTVVSHDPDGTDHTTNLVVELRKYVKKLRSKGR